METYSMYLLTCEFYWVLMQMFVLGWSSAFEDAYTLYHKARAKVKLRSNRIWK